MLCRGLATPTPRGIEGLLMPVDAETNSLAQHPALFGIGRRSPNFWRTKGLRWLVPGDRPPRHPRGTEGFRIAVDAGPSAECCAGSRAILIAAISVLHVYVSMYAAGGCARHAGRAGRSSPLERPGWQGKTHRK